MTKGANARDDDVRASRRSPRLGYARTYAEKNDKEALASFFKSYAHHTARHAAGVAAPVAAKS